MGGGITFGVFSRKARASSRGARHLWVPTWNLTEDITRQTSGRDDDDERQARQKEQGQAERSQSRVGVDAHRFHNVFVPNPETF